MYCVRETHIATHKILQKLTNTQTLTMPKISLLDRECIQCKSEIDLSIDNFTLFQAEKGRHYLYCDNCMSPYEPIQLGAQPASLKYNTPIFALFLVFMIGLYIGSLI